MTSSDRAIVTVQLDGTAETHDVEVPVNVPAAGLGAAIADALGWSLQAYAVWAEPPGRALADDETLADAGAWEGAHLILLTGGHAVEAAERTDQPGYVWKRLDPD
jgi:hypothetical protein